MLLTILLISAVVALGYLFLTWNFDYFKKRGINGPKPQPFVGNYPNSLTRKKHMVDDLNDIYWAYKKDEDFVGIFQCRSPQVLVLSPALVRRVFVTDFKHFHDNQVSEMIDEKSDFIFANNPLTLAGEKWKNQRAKMTPGLTMSRVKCVYPVTQKICQKLNGFIRTQLRSPPKDGIDVRDLSMRFTTEAATGCVLGLNADSFSDKPTPIMAMSQKIFNVSFSFIFYTTLVALLPSLKPFYKGRFIPLPVEKFFMNLMQSAIDMRKAQPQLFKDRLDFLNYLLQLQEKHKLSTLQLTGNTLSVLLDGFETSGIALSHCLLLLARNASAQEKLRAEIVANLNEQSEIEFEKLTELPYLDACIHEAMRIFPPGSFSTKLCTEPIEWMNKNGRTLKLERGDWIVLPLNSFMMDEDYFPNPQEFQPERFTDEPDAVKKYREMGVFYPFGDGPRVCTGMRFALTQIKAALVEILKNFKVRVNPKTRKDNQLDPKYFLTQLNGGIWLDFEAIN